jgi:cytochrome b561
MQESDFVNRYSGVAMMLHWLIAGLIIVNVCLGIGHDYAPDEAQRRIIDLHKSIGITVLGLAIMRLLWRMVRRPPDLPREMPVWEKKSAHLVHILLYCLIFLLPLSGWLHDSAWKDAATHPMHLFGLFEWPRIGIIEHVEPTERERLHDQFGALHTWLGYILYVLFTAHVLGALKHQFIDHQPELQRMWPRRSTGG